MIRGVDRDTGGRVLFDGHALVDYGNFELAGEETWEDSGEAFRSGAVNALLAIGDPGHLFFRTGTYYGDVPVNVSLFADEPPVGDMWEDVVEAPWESDGSKAILLSFDRLLCPSARFQRGPTGCGGAPSVSRQLTAPAAQTRRWTPTPCTYGLRPPRLHRS